MWRPTALVALAAFACVAAQVTADGTFTCSKSSSKPGYRCTRFNITNLSPWPLSLTGSSLKHGEWQAKPPASIAASGGVGAFEANSDCPLLDCFYGASPSASFSWQGETVTFYGENNLDKLLYGCNKAEVSTLPDALEGVVESLAYDGDCYCCRVGCDCSKFDNKEHWEAFVSVAAVPNVTSISPATAPSAGTTVTLSGAGFADASGLACQFGDGKGGTVNVPATFVSATQITCVAPPLLAPGHTAVAVSATNLGSKWSAAQTFTYVAKTAGAKAIVGSGTVQSLLAAALPAASAAIQQVQIPTMSGEETVIGITIDYTLTNITLPTFDFGTVTVASSADSGVTLSCSGAKVVAAMGWSFVDKGTIIKGHGTAVDTLGADLSISISFVQNNGHLGVDHVTASMDVTDLDISTEPKIAEIINLLKGPLKSAIAKAASGALETGLAGALNGILGIIPTSVPVGPLDIDLALMFDPTVSSSGVSFYLAAEGYLAGDHSEPPFAATELPTPPSPPADTSYILLSDWLANSALWALFDHGLLQGTVTPSMIPPSVPIHLNTSLFGSIIPMDKLYPGRLFSIGVNATQRPVVALGANTPAGVELDAYLDLTFLVDCHAPKAALRGAADADDCTPIDATTVGVGMSAALSVAMASTRANDTNYLNMTGHLDDLHFNISILESNIGNYTTDGLNMLLNVMMRAVAMAELNDMLQAGVLIPAGGDTPGSLQALNATLAFSPGYMLFSTDLAVTPAALTGLAASAARMFGDDDDDAWSRSHA